MDENEFYYHFCNVMRRHGSVKLKNISSSACVSLAEARKHLNNLIKQNRIKKTGQSRATAYVFG
jgi:hypothetical protein